MDKMIKELALAGRFVHYVRISPALTFQQKKAVVEAKRPAPELPGLRQGNRKFTGRHYRLYGRLPGDSVITCLYCFPCALFSHENTKWSKYGYY